MIYFFLLAQRAIFLKFQILLSFSQIHKKTSSVVLITSLIISLFRVIERIFK